MSGNSNPLNWKSKLVQGICGKCFWESCYPKLTTRIRETSPPRANEMPYPNRDS